MRLTNLESREGLLERRVTELERIRFEGDFMARALGVSLQNRGQVYTNWGADVGGINAVNFERNHKIGTIDLLSGRPLVNGTSMTSRARLGIKFKLDDDVQAALRLAAFTSTGNVYLDNYWGVTAPFLSNAFAESVVSSVQSNRHTPWTRLNFDSFMLQHKPSSIRLTVGSIYDTLMDYSVVARVPNPNVAGRSMAKFSEEVVSARRNPADVVTLPYYEDEETYLPFFGVQVRGKGKLVMPFEWEGMAVQLPSGPNPTAGPNQPAVNAITIPYLYTGNVTFDLNGQGDLRLNFARAQEELHGGVSGMIPNHGNYWFWSDPIGFAGRPDDTMPMRANAYISRQSQTSYGATLAYRFEPSNIRALLAYDASQYKPNLSSAYTARGSHYRVGLGWTNSANNLNVDLEYLNTNPYYDAFQVYFAPLGGMSLGGVPPGTPIAFAVVPLYYAGFPGSYAPFAYQLHDSGLYPNNRNGFRFAGTWRFLRERAQLALRAAFLEQNQPTVPQRDVTGVMNGQPPGFIDPVFHPLRTDGVVVNESPRGREKSLGGTLEYDILPKKLKGTVQYDTFKFLRSTAFDPATDTARRNYVNVRYDVLQCGLDYNVTKKLTLHAGYNQVNVRGYHPTLLTLYTNTTYNPRAGTNLLDTTQRVPYLGLDYDFSPTASLNVTVRQMSSIDVLNDPISPESFRGTQVISQFKCKF